MFEVKFRYKVTCPTFPTGAIITSPRLVMKYCKGYITYRALRELEVKGTISFPGVSITKVEEV